MRDEIEVILGDALPVQIVFLSHLESGENRNESNEKAYGRARYIVSVDCYK